MKTEEAKKKQAELICMVETCKDRIKYLNDKISKLGFIINKKDDWRDEVPYLTLELSQLISNKIQLMQEMHAFAYVRNEGWVPDWDNEEKKWGLLREFGHVGHVAIDYTFYYNQFVFGIVVSSEEIAEEMREEFGERIEEIYNKQY